MSGDNIAHTLVLSECPFHIVSAKYMHNWSTVISQASHYLMYYYIKDTSIFSPIISQNDNKKNGKCCCWQQPKRGNELHLP